MGNLTPKKWANIQHYTGMGNFKEIFWALQLDKNAVYKKTGDKHS